ncbi:Mini-ribonuclease 3 [Paenibacillus sp. 1P07SE]|uniref:Mini-ribonuclease 3 n=1 Tax=Paenibacillus sp. 1P07SE TaxID=3132209 RepID=UPI0039A65ECC
MSEPRTGELGEPGLWFHIPAKHPNQMNPVVLAYIGDAVYELLVRQYLLSKPNHKLHHLHSQAVSFVSAKAQSALLRRLQPLLTEEEADIVRRGRNAKSGAPPKNADVQEYRLATSFECLLGYLYCQKRTERLHELLAYAWPEANGRQEDQHEEATEDGH